MGDQTEAGKKNLTEEEVSAGKDIVLGGKLFKVVDSPERTFFFDTEEREGISFPGSLFETFGRDRLQEKMTGFFKQPSPVINGIENFFLEYAPGLERSLFYMREDQSDWSKINTDRWGHQYQLLETSFGRTGREGGPFYFKVNKVSPDESKIIFYESDLSLQTRPIESDFSKLIKADFDTAKKMVEDTVKILSDEKLKNVKITGKLIQDRLNYKTLSPEEKIAIAMAIDPEPATEAKANGRQIKFAEKAGYVQGVCECVAAVFGDNAFGKKLLSEMHVTKDMAKKYAHPETYKVLEQGIFAPESKQELQQSLGGRGR